ncbi:MAG: FHA domain-containing protein [Candidatus Schekmanbacteria bacterium]|nr:FHA domain-containing protein [Candidatus Schekmanbacteria bacterium]
MILEGRLVVEGGPAAGRAFDVTLRDTEQVSIGKSASCTVQIADSSVSRHHATLYLHHGQAMIRDESSTNGTILNGRRLADAAPLPSGSRVQLGPRTTLRFVSGGEALALPVSPTDELRTARRAPAVQVAPDSTPVPPRPTPTAAPAPPSPSAPDAWMLKGQGTVVRSLADANRHFLVGSIPGSGLRAIELAGTVSIVGREQDAQIVLPEASISKQHARLMRAPTGLLLEDLGSTNGTFVNGRRVTQHLLQPGETVSFDAYPFVYRVLPPGASPDSLLPASRRRAGPLSWLLPLGLTAAVVALGLLAGYLYLSRQQERFQRARDRLSTYQTAELLDAAHQHVSAALLASRSSETVVAFENMQAALDCLDLANLPSRLKGWQILRLGLPPEDAGLDLAGLYATLQEQVAKMPPEQLARLQEARLGGRSPSNEPVVAGSKAPPRQPLGPLSPEARRARIRDEITRLSEGFGERAPANQAGFTSSVERFVDEYSAGGMREQYVRGLQRGRKYNALLKQVLARRKLPENLIYVAFVESNFYPQARSKAGAVGLWQLMPGTAKDYGLRVTKAVDERTDPLKSTEAAREIFLDHLSIFGSGSFFLAMAAYNAGDGKVRWALKQLDDPLGTRSFWRLVEQRLLATETTEYVPRIMAIAIISAAPDAFGISGEDPLETMSTAPAYETVIVERPVSLRMLAELAVTSVGELQRLNPAIPEKALTTPAGKPFGLHVPSGTAETVAQELQRIGVPAHAAATVPTDEAATEPTITEGATS